MDKLTKDIKGKSEAALRAMSSQYGGVLAGIADGWTEAKNVGNAYAGVGLACGVAFFVVCTCIIERDSSAASYLKALGKALDYASLKAMITDGAANMVKLTREMHAMYAVIPVVCMAHGISLVLQHFGKYFDEEYNVWQQARVIINFFRRSTKNANALKDANLEKIPIPRAMCTTRFAYNVLAAVELVEKQLAMHATILSLRASESGNRRAATTTTTSSSASSSRHDQTAPNKRQRTATTATTTTTMNDDAGEDVMVDEEETKPAPSVEKAYLAVTYPKLFDNLRLFSEISLPIYYVLRLYDSGFPMLGFNFWVWARLESIFDQN
jgi:hypothetical protein